MKTTNKKTLEEIIRVDHAGERGAIKIYEGQLLALNTFKKNEKLKKLIEEMKEHEKEHFEYFDKAIKERNIKPTVFLPIWDLLGVTLGFGTTMLGEKAAMLCTASVEEVIDGHYKSQLDKLGDDEESLKQIGFDKSINKLVLHQAKLASKANLDGIVCSPKEIKLVKKVFKKEIITPGIRMFKDKKVDQVRTMSPKQAIKNGATALVIGRSLTKGNIEKNIQKLISELK